MNCEKKVKTINRTLTVPFNHIWSRRDEGIFGLRAFERLSSQKYTLQLPESEAYLINQNLYKIKTLS